MLKLRHASIFILLLLPAALLANAVWLWRQLNEARAVSLRETAARIAARLEVASDPESEAVAEMIADEAPSLLGLRIHRAEGAPANLSSLFTGGELYRVERPSPSMFRAYVPFHHSGQTWIAQIDLDRSSAAHLAGGALLSALISGLSAAALTALTAFYFWSQRREARRREESARLARLAEIGRMGAVLAHEIRNPLGAVKGFLQLAREQTPAAPRQHLDAALEQLARLERLTNDLLRFTRVPAPQLRPVSWPEIVSRLRPLAPMARFDDGEWTWRTDVAMVEQILLNLIRNAEEAVTGVPAPEILVRAGDRRIEVCDNGPGVAPEMRARLFEPFATNRARGTGLGLAISRNLAEALGARLELSDRRQGGTCARLLWRAS